MNSKVIDILAKLRVKFQEKIGEPITMSEAIKIETEKLRILAKENTYNY